MTGTTSKTTSKAGTDTRPLTATDLQQGALDAIDGYSETVTALTVVADRIAALHTPDPAPLDAVSLTALLLRGESLPDDIGAVIRAHAERTAARHHEVQLLGAVHDALERRREAAIRTGADAAFAWLGERLHELVDQGREVLVRLGSVRSAEQALDAEDPRKARDGLRELSELAERHEQLREAQLGLISTVAAANGQHLIWSELLGMVRQHGMVSNPDVAGTPAGDALGRFVWLIDSPAVPAVPTYGSMTRRAAGPKPTPAQPPSPTSEGEPYLTGPGTDAQRAQRLRTRVGLGPIT